MYQRRALDDVLDQLLPYSAAIALDGAKAVGKTETAKQRAHHVFELDNEAQRKQFIADTSLSYLPDDATILLDEWQQYPPSWDIVRRAVDNGAPPGRFLLTGSATPIAGTTTHSGAGRILSLKMRPMALFERPTSPPPAVSLADLLLGKALGKEGSAPVLREQSSFRLGDYVHAIAQSGFPALLDLPQPVRERELNSYIQRIVDRDLPDQGYSVRDSDSLRGWMRAYAAASSTVANYNTILDAATAGEGDKPSRVTATMYRNKLSEIWMLDPVPAWNYIRAPFARATTTQKHQLADPALALRLLSITEDELVRPRFSYLLGPLFESLATLSVRAAAEVSMATVGHFRDRAGEHEIDLIVEGTNGKVVAMEVKLAEDPTDGDVRHLLWLKAQLPDDVTDMVVLTTGSRAYRRDDGVAVVPLALLGP